MDQAGAANFAPAMTEDLRQRSSQPVAAWLLVGVGMMVIQILLGGITRLTGSGLSITEWNIVTGTLPPLNESQWITEFEKYRQTPQFQLLNYDFTLKDFKFIFFWEWLHRFWARLIGLVFAIPFLIFLVQKRFRADTVRPLLILFLLGALQGVVGWIMVASGLTGDAVYVKPTRLAIHFILAMGLLAYTFWFSLRLRVPRAQQIHHAGLRTWTWIILLVIAVQFIYGALMAGHKAATAAPTWPDINGAVFPAGMLAAEHGIYSFIDNKITIHFIHRGLAYLLLVLIAIWTWRAHRLPLSSSLTRTKWWPILLVILQAVLGVLSVLVSIKIIPGQWGVFEWMAQAHQFVAMLLWLTFIRVLYLVKSR